MVLLFLIFSVLLAIVSGAFALQNTAPVTVSFLTYKFDGPLAVVLLVTFGLGLATAGLAILPSLLTSKWQSLSLKRRLRRSGETHPQKEVEAVLPPVKVPPQEPPLP